MARPVVPEPVEGPAKNTFLQATNIDFAYDKKKIIDNISLTIPEHTTTAIVGPSGGGKTTFCHLLSRFWDVDKGRIVEQGKHDDLVKLGGIYARFIDSRKEAVSWKL